MSHAKFDRQTAIQAKTAACLIQLVVEDLFPEHHVIMTNNRVDNQTTVVFSGFLDQIHLSEIQKTINYTIQTNSTITRKYITPAEILADKISLTQPIPNLKKVPIVSIGDYSPILVMEATLKSTAECWPITLTEFTYEDGFTIIHYQVSAPQKTQPQKPQPIKPIIGLTLDQFREQLNKIPASPSKSDFKALSQEIPKLPISDRAPAGRLLNKLKSDLSSKFNRLSDYPINRSTTWLDVTAPGIQPPTGHLHLISQTIDEIETIFSRLGFIRRRYPEIETDWYYAEGLNIPKDHPARDDQETFYFSDNVVLTAHTSNGQLREMELIKTPPIKMINIGKTYRRQASATHSPMFHQFEGLLIDTGITMAHLVGVSNYFVKAYFGPNRQIRLRPHHFQFTEPSFEVDINCHLCQGRGVIDQKPCRVCKSGWLELGGAGMVHPVVLKNGGLDASKYTGFAFGWGVERIIMMKHQVTSNLRELYTDDLRFLEQS